METIFEIKNNLPVKYEEFGTSLKNGNLYRVSFVLNEATLENMQELEDYFDGVLGDYDVNIDFERSKITITTR